MQSADVSKPIHAPELLAGNYKFGCDACTEMRNRRMPPAEKGEKRDTVYSNASKQLLSYSPPPVLTIHLKRFEVCRFSLRKVNRHVQFGERLDLAPFCSSISQDLTQMRPGQRRVLYSLFGVVEHSGRLTSAQRPLHGLRSSPPAARPAHRQPGPAYPARHGRVQDGLRAGRAAGRADGAELQGSSSERHADRRGVGGLTDGPERCPDDREAAVGAKAGTGAKAGAGTRSGGQRRSQS